jgi:adenosine deaminase
VAPARTAGLIDYLQRIDVACSTARAMEDWARIGWEAVEDCFNDGLSYVELRFSPWFIHAQTGLDPIGVIMATFAKAHDAGLRVTIHAGEAAGPVTGDPRQHPAGAGVNEAAGIPLQGAHPVGDAPVSHVQWRRVRVG